MPKKKNSHYLDNKRLEEVIVLYQGDNKKHEDELIKLFDLLITNIYTTFKFKVELEDAKQECFLLILKTLKNFDTTKGSAFNFFTTIIIHNLKLIYTKNKKYKDKINHYIESKTGHNPSSL